MTTPHLRLAVAPRFHLSPDWSGRLTAGAGVQETGGRFFPRGPWRPLTAAELSWLTEGAEDRADDAEAGCLFAAPQHLREAWWKLLDGSVETGGIAPAGFEDFTRRVDEFLRFKHRDVPACLQMEAVVTAAGRPSIRTDAATGAPVGLGPSLPPWGEVASEKGALPRLWAVVNLGDEDAWLLLMDVVLSKLAAQPASRPSGRPAPETIGSLTERFLRESSESAPIRMRLGPWEGFRLPTGGLILDGDTSGKQEPDVLLLISAHASDRLPD